MTQKIINDIISHAGVTNIALIEHIVNAIQKERIVDMAVVGCNRPNGSKYSDLKRVTEYLRNNNIIRFDYRYPPQYVFDESKETPCKSNERIADLRSFDLPI